MTGMESIQQQHLPRSVQWRSWLGVFQGHDLAEWVHQAQERRETYSSLLRKFTATPSNDDDDLQINNPLSQHQRSSWSQFFRSADLQSTIDLDLVRTHPTKPFFQSPQTQTQMRNVLFVWAQLHPNVSYRQGMNELLSPIIMVRSDDANNADQVFTDELRILSDQNFIEHDSFAIFEVLMSNVSNLFISEPFDTENQQPPIVARSEYVQNVLLKEADSELYLHLNKVGVQPQLYGLRWLRLLLAREFTLSNVFIIWDAIFRSSSDHKLDCIYSLPFVDYLCVAMLQFVRKDLLQGDHSACIRRLLSYPPVGDISELITRAEHLLNGENVTGVNSFQLVPVPIEPEKEQPTPPLPKRLEPNSPAISPGRKERAPSLIPNNVTLTNNQMLGIKLEDLVAVMQREIRKGQSACDQGILLQCLAKVKLIKDVLIGNLSFDSVADEMKERSHPLV